MYTFLLRYQGVSCVMIARNYHLNASLKVVYLSEIFNWHDAMLNDPRFSTPNCSVFLTGSRIISIISTTSQLIQTKIIISQKLGLYLTAQTLDMESKVNCAGNSDMKLRGYDSSQSVEWSAQWTISVQSWKKARLKDTINQWDATKGSIFAMRIDSVAIVTSIIRK